MPQRQNSAAFQRLRHFLSQERCRHLPDEQLLDRFIADHDEGAFTALFERHSPMVLGVCQSVLRHTQDAEDVCQASFLMLARKAATIRRKTAVASWLHGVAFRLAINLQASRKQVASPDATLKSRSPSLWTPYAAVSLIRLSTRNCSEAMPSKRNPPAWPSTIDRRRMGLLKSRD